MDEEKIIEIHQDIALKYSLNKGCLNKSNLISVLHKINEKLYHKELYPDVFDKAAVLFESIIRKHPFIDGNKRTALATVQEFLFECDYLFILPLSSPRFSIKIANLRSQDPDRIEQLIANISKWIRYRTVRITDHKAMKTIFDDDIKFFVNLKKISAIKGRPSMPQEIINYFLGVDIYPENIQNYTFIIEFYKERMVRLLNLIKRRRN